MTQDTMRSEARPHCCELLHYGLLKTSADNIDSAASQVSIIYHHSRKVILLVDRSHVKSLENEKKTLPFSDIYIGGAPSSMLLSRWVHKGKIVNEAADWVKNIMPIYCSYYSTGQHQRGLLPHTTCPGSLYSTSALHEEFSCSPHVDWVCIYSPEISTVRQLSISYSPIVPSLPWTSVSCLAFFKNMHWKRCWKIDGVLFMQAIQSHGQYFF